jgi:hypothetical protein
MGWFALSLQRPKSEILTLLAPVMHLENRVMLHCNKLKLNPP